MTRLIDELLKRGLVERRRASNDQRVVTVSLTAPSRIVAKRLREATFKNWKNWLTS